MSELYGQLAALGTSILFSFGSTLFTLAGRKVGSPTVNRTRLLVAFPLVILMHYALTGSFYPVNASFHPIFWLGLSGFVGLALGDALLFQGFVMIGPRLSMLMMALAPVLATVAAWIFLDEILALKELAGIALTVGGVAWVVSEKQPGTSIEVSAETPRDYAIGVLFAFGGAMGQAGGVVLAKAGLVNSFPAISGNLIRLTAAVIAMWALALLRGEVTDGFRRLRAQPVALHFLSIGAVTGPVIGVWLSLVAVQNTDVGIASAIIALTPIFLIPISRFVFKTRITGRAIAGTLLAFSGTALLFI